MNKNQASMGETSEAALKRARERILDIVCIGRHKRGGPACQASCGIQVRRIMDEALQPSLDAAQSEEARWWRDHCGHYKCPGDMRIAALERTGRQP